MTIMQVETQPSSWSTLRIRPSWPHSRLRLSLLLVLLLKYIPCLSWPPSILLFVPTDRVSHLTPSLLSGRLLINVQVNNTTVLQYMTNMGTRIYITSALLFFFSSILLPSFLAGRLAQTLSVWHNNSLASSRESCWFSHPWHTFEFYFVQVFFYSGVSFDFQALQFHRLGVTLILSSGSGFDFLIWEWLWFSRFNVLVRVTHFISHVEVILNFSSKSYSHFAFPFPHQGVASESRS